MHIAMFCVLLCNVINHIALKFYDESKVIAEVITLNYVATYF